MTVRTRFAPSPTGSLHVGGARTALYCLLYARRHGGQFLLRIEDTDRVRSTDEATRGILRDLTWLGLQWDEGPGVPGDTGPYLQSERLHTYAPYFDTLTQQGLAYDAWDSVAELGAMRDAAMADKRNFRYRQRTWTDDELAAFREEGRNPILRLKAPDHDVHLHDEILGDVTIVAEELEDIVVRKADGFPTYHFAVVVDDHLMGVSLVLRGQEHLMNTHKHLGLYEALGWAPPRHGHLPLIFNMAGSKMSKRDKAKAARTAAREAARARAAEGHDEGNWTWLAEATGLPLDEIVTFVSKKADGVSTAEAIASVLGVELPMIEVMDFRRAGYLPAALNNYLALLGWSPGDDREILSMEELTEAFTLDGIGKTAAKFDVDKLSWMNSEYIKAATPEALLDAQDAYLEVVPHSPFAGMPRAQRAAYLALYQTRIATLSDLDRQAGFFFAAPATWDDKAVIKHLRKGGGTERLAQLRDVLAAMPVWEDATLEATLHAWAELQELGMGKVAQPIRVAVTGNGVSPPIGATLELIGQAETVARIDACLAAVAQG